MLWKSSDDRHITTDELVTDAMRKKAARVVFGYLENGSDYCANDYVDAVLRICAPALIARGMREALGREGKGADTYER